jgi:hypothetical protein
MELNFDDLDRLQNYGVGGLTTYEEQMALINLARKALFQQGLIFECPDCGYNVMREEVDQYLSDSCIDEKDLYPDVP